VLKTTQEIVAMERQLREEHSSEKEVLA